MSYTPPGVIIHVKIWDVSLGGGREPSLLAYLGSQWSSKSAKFLCHCLPSFCQSWRVAIAVVFTRLQCIPYPLNDIRVRGKIAKYRGVTCQGGRVEERGKEVGEVVREREREREREFKLHTEAVQKQNHMSRTTEKLFYMYFQKLGHCLKSVIPPFGCYEFQSQKGRGKS